MSDLNGNIAGCCDDAPTTVQPPFNELRKRGRGWKGLKMFDLENPIPDEIKDPETLSKFFEQHKLVPYAGGNQQAGHLLLTWYLMLAQLSPMHSACIAKLKNYVVGSRAIFERATDPEYDTGEDAQPMTNSETQTYYDALKEFVTFEGGVRLLHQRLLWSLKATGNAYLEVAWSEVNGEMRFVFSFRRPTEVLYKVTKPNEPRIFAVSPVWTDEYLRKNPPVLIPLAPNIWKDETGTNRTIFHLKSGNGKWYGRPDSEGADIYKYREVQDEIYLVKQAAANFVGQLIIEVEDDDPETSPAIDNEDARRSGFDSFAHRMEQNYTQKSGDPQAVFVTARPMGSRPMFVFQLKPNTNEGWYKVTGEMAEQKILRAHGLTLRFMGFDASTGFSSDTFIADYVMNVEPVIESLRSSLMNFTNTALSFAWGILGKEDLNKFSLNFQSPITSKIQEFKELQRGNTDLNNTGGSSQGITGRR